MSTPNELARAAHEGATRDELEVEAARSERRLLTTVAKVDRRALHVEEEVQRFPHRLLMTVLAGSIAVAVIATALSFRRRPRRPVVRFYVCL